MDTSSKPKLYSNVYSSKVGLVTASIWACNGGPGITLHLTEGEARELAQSLTDAANSLPRLGTPADLGCEAL